MEGMVDKNFWSGKIVLVTGHTGFKGSWLSTWLNKMGANVIGISLPPTSSPNIYESIEIGKDINSLFIDIRDKDRVKNVFSRYKPDMVFHLAAQPLVRQSYDEPVETYEVNVIGTANILNEAYKCNNTKGVINITTDKCYENKEWCWGYRENDSLGGYDPYSSSKAASEILSASFRKSFYEKEGKFLATVRAGNVVGGGDWAKDRIVPDIIRSIYENEKLTIRSSSSIRPFQHVLEPLNGYITLMQKIWDKPEEFNGAWNFGPNNESIVTVKKLTEILFNSLGIDDLDNKIEFLKENKGVHEAKLLKLDSTKAKELLEWSPKLNINECLKWTGEWYKAFYEKENIRQFTVDQIEKYESL
ncbi:MAG: CDP-glucose 4,6-dehydratase [Clostridium sp.]